MVLILKGVSTLGNFMFTISQVISILLGLWICFTMVMDIFKNIPNTLASQTHPNNLTKDEPGETYTELWNQQKKGYFKIMVFSLICRSISLFLLIYWFL